MKLAVRAAFSAALVIAATGLSAVPTSAQAAETNASGVVADRYFSVPYNEDIWALKGSVATKLTPAQFAALNKPAITRAAVSYVKYSWSATVYGVSFLGGAAESSWAWKALTAGEWARAGYPTVRNAGWVAGTTYYKWATGAGLFAQAPDASPAHHLTGAEWRATGGRTYQNYTNAGFMKLPISDTAIQYSDIKAGVGSHLTLGDWVKLGLPEIKVVKRLPGDRVTRVAGSQDITYTFPGQAGSFKLSFAQWLAIGAPNPQVIEQAAPAEKAATEQLIAAVNAERVKANLPPVQELAQMSEGAGAWATQGCRSSASPWGSDPKLAASLPAGWRGAADSVAVPSTGNVTDAINRSLAAWLGNPTTREFLLQANFNRIGAAVVSCGAKSFATVRYAIY